ncbi:MAG: hypothetical protein N5P05_001057 [Chroococcopsis gigantea SAG 12.99]|jgi:Rps23 Pro-64 3,4-dihydroxylase Tpa1-like proline 4-hydroxylase|nr:2OG-Fe(II) oxygenase [Chlorogloea purpurea SAG 13.99]MDV2999451.1 hypothetical protein [Chroococcopsis gigantea SAG 12.99]
MSINKLIFNNLTKYQAIFNNAKPFKHVVVDNFLDHDLALLLLQDFPEFNTRKAMSEVGTVGKKAVNEDLYSISDIYNYFANWVQSKEFLDKITEITGIDHLIPDPTFYGGGTHENLHGQELDPHVDFNMDERRWHHRRLNILIYLNQEWSEEWGGLLELHSDPRSEDNEIISFLPCFNRCIIFETGEYSWHGFNQIQLPDEQQDRSRKSLSIYLYTKERPVEDLAPSHTTFYVPRPLPDSIQPGEILKSEDYEAMRILLKRRDDLILFYQKRELEDSKSLVSLKSHIKRYISTQYPQVWRYLKIFLLKNK